MSTNSEIDLSKCPACGSSNIETHYVPEEDDYVIFFRCHTCELVLPEGNINRIRDWWRKINIIAIPRDKEGRKIQKGDWISDGKKCYKVEEPYFSDRRQCWHVDVIAAPDLNVHCDFPARDMILCPLNKVGEPILIGDEVYPEDDYDAPYKVNGYEKDALVRIEAMLPSHKDLKLRTLAGSLLYHKTFPYLLPCPFCGNKAEMESVSSLNSPLRYYAYCTTCGTSQTMKHKTAKDSASAWNRREGEEQ